MEQQTTTVKNKGLLIVAAVLALLVVIIYWWHVGRIREEGRGETIKLLVYTRNIDKGDVLTLADVSVGAYSKSLGRNFEARKPEEVVGETLVQDVEQGQFFQWIHVQGGRRELPSETITRHMEAFTVPLEPRTTPGEVLSIGDKAALIGQLAIKGRPLQAYRIIENVRVIAINGVAGRTRAIAGRRRRVSSTAQRTFKSVVIEVSPRTSVKLVNILSHVVGQIYITVQSPKDQAAVNDIDGPQVNAELSDLKALDRRGRAALLRGDNTQD